MKHFNKLFSVMIGLILSTTAVKAQAGVVTTVVVKNQLAQPVSLVPSSVTQILGSGSPPSPIPSGATRTFTVTSPYSNIASIHFSYTTGTKQCRFSTSLTTRTNLFGSIPNWTKSGSPTGFNVNCDAKITSVNSTNYNYTVEFTLR